MSYNEINCDYRHDEAREHADTEQFEDVLARAAESAMVSLGIEGSFAIGAFGNTHSVRVYVPLVGAAGKTPEQISTAVQHAVVDAATEHVFGRRVAVASLRSTNVWAKPVGDLPGKDWPLTHIEFSYDLIERIVHA